MRPFDFANGPIARGHFVGDHHELAPIGPRGLLDLFSVTGMAPEFAKRALDAA